MKAIAKAAFTAVALTVVAGANANVITTLFVSNNEGDLGGGVYFDATVGANDIMVTSFYVNTFLAVGASFGFQAWTHTGTYVGTTGSTAGWTMVTNGAGISQGLDVPSGVLINTPFVLTSGVNAIALTLSDTGQTSAAHRYTNGDGTNQNYSNADVALSLGAASNVFLSGTPFSPRVWNGTITYVVVPEPGTFIALGIGLAGLAMLRRRK
jgi:hypothetical protein